MLFLLVRPSIALLNYGLVLALSLAFCQQLGAEERNADVDQVRGLIFENDQFTFDDDGYTNGVAYVWGYGGFDSFDKRTPAWMEWLVEDAYVATMPDKERAISYGIVQQIITPSRTADKKPDPNDRPYAGLLWWQANWYASDETLADKITLELGLVGPGALAEYSQKGIHSITGASDPQGWDEQLDNEPIFRVAAKRNWRLGERSFDSFKADMVSHLAAGAGNRRSDVGAGISFRIGRGLKRNLGNASVEPVLDINPLAGGASAMYAFVGFGGRYVFNDISLDGNTFENSASVDLEHWQGQASLGTVLDVGKWSWRFSLYMGSDEWDTQRDNSKYGSLSLSYRLDAGNR